jgi:sigma-B regulation protein RsbU (phosphoserine phosphatase)
VTSGDDLVQDSAEELFESAPCGYLTTRLDGTILRVNRTFEAWTGFGRERLSALRFQELLTPGGRIYHDTHYAPLLRMQGAVREIALDLVRADGSRLPVLVNSVVREDAEGSPRVVRTTVFDATDRRRYEQELVRARELEHEVALELQRSLLSGELPAGDGLATEVVYRPAVRGQEVGGDWYDAFWIDEPGTLALVVGDVVGRGIGAAATMGQLRSAVRALASTGLSPAALLDGLDRYARTHGVGRMATLAYAEVDVATRRVRYACAGHPPPALLEPGRPARLLWDGRSLPLDAHAVVHPRAEATLALAAGGALVLYSDGLVERRDRLMDAGLDELLAVLERVRDAPGPGGLADAMARRLLARAGPTDDVCVLALRLTAP